MLRARKSLHVVRENDVAHASVVSDDMPRYATGIQTTSVTITILSECEHNSKRARRDLRVRHSDNRLKYHQGNRSLTELSLERNFIDDEGASALAEALKATLVIRTASSSPESCW